MFIPSFERRGLIAASLLFGALCLYPHASARLFRVEAQTLDARTAPRSAQREAEKRGVQATVAPTPPQTEVARETAPAPPRVVAVVHRLRGWKLISWLAAYGPPSLELDALPSASESRTSVVAGLLTDDGRAVVARLPQVETELEISPAPAALRKLLEGEDDERSDFTVVLNDGRKVEARFVGFDASSGLSLLETKEALQTSLAGDEGDTEEPSVGQPVRLFAPAPLSVAASASRAPLALHKEGELALGIEQMAGMLTDVARTPTGKPFRLTAHAGGISSAWAGAIATDESGAVVGVVSQSASGQTQIVPVETMRRAVERIRRGRSSVQQPWLGARGDSAFDVPEEKWVVAGWKPEQFAAFMRAHGGVLLTSVVPDTPASVAGLKAGDVIERVGEREVKGVDDLSFALLEQAVGSTVDFTVRRPVESSPLRVPVHLSGTPNPALETAQAEVRAARVEYIAAYAELRAARSGRASLKGRPDAETKALRASTDSRVAEAERRLSQAMRALTEAELRASYARARISPANAASPAQPAPLQFRPLLAFGLRTIGLTPRASARMGADGGQLVISVDRHSPAESAGIRPGDVVERVNGETPTPDALRRLMRDAPEWAYVFDIVRDSTRSRLELRLVNRERPRR